jgi:hypothetical protein
MGPTLRSSASLTISIARYGFFQWHGFKRNRSHHSVTTQFCWTHQLFQAFVCLPGKRPTYKSPFSFLRMKLGELKWVTLQSGEGPSWTSCTIYRLPLGPSRLWSIQYRSKASGYRRDSLSPRTEQCNEKEKPDTLIVLKCLQTSTQRMLVTVLAPIFTLIPE